MGQFHPSRIPFYLEVARGKISGMGYMNKFGENPDVDAGTTPEDIWDYGGTYTFSTSAIIDTVSSNNAGDSQDVIIEGLDLNWDITIQTATLNGTTKVTLDTSLIRCYRAYNANGTSFTGDIYIYEDDTTTTPGVPDTASKVRAMIRVGNNQTLMCIYTIPANKTGFFLGGFVSLSGSGHPAGTIANMSWNARPFGGVFLTKSRINIADTGSSAWFYEYPIPPTLSEKTDIKIICSGCSQDGVGISGAFDLLLEDIDI